MESQFFKLNFSKRECVLNSGGHHGNQYLPQDGHYLKTRLKHYRIEEDQIITEHKYDYIQILKLHYFSREKSYIKMGLI